MKETLLPDYGTLYTLQEFIERCIRGCFIDYDGSGYYSDGRIYWRDLPAYPSDMVKGRAKYGTNYRFVIWFNK